MSYQVSSWFQSQLTQRHLAPVRKFLVEDFYTREILTDSPGDWTGANSHTQETGAGGVIVASDTSIYVTRYGNLVDSLSCGAFPNTMDCITIDAWVYTVPPASYSTLFSVWSDDATNRVNVHHPWVSGPAFYWDFGNISSGGRITTSWNSAWYNRWDHWTWRAGSGQPMSVMRNGTVVLSSNTYGGPVADGIVGKVFRIFGGDVGRMEAGMFMLRVWSHYVSDADVSSLARWETTGSEAGLLMQVPLNEGSGLLIHDDTRPNTGTVVGSALWGAHPRPYGSPTYTSSPYAPFSYYETIQASSLTYVTSDYGQGITLQIDVSTDGGASWAGWADATDGAAVPGMPDTLTSSTQLRYRAVFSMTDINNGYPSLEFVDVLFDNLGQADYSDRVLKWPKVKRDWNSVRPQDLSVDFANEDGALNFFYKDGASLTKRCLVRFGFTHPTSGDELVTLYSGKTDHLQYRNGKVTLSLLDKFKQLTEREVGMNGSPVTFTDSTLPSDIAWVVVTSWGGYSAVQSTSNPDIDYQAWLDWAAVFSVDQVYMNGSIEGRKCAEVLSAMAPYTQSAIYVENDRLVFRRFSAADSAQTALNNDGIIDLELEVNDADIVNKQYVLGGYDPAVDTYTVTGLSVVTTSVNTFGPREQTEKTQFIWYVSSTAANVMATRITYVTQTPYPKIKVTAPLLPALRQVGDTITVTDDERQISGESYRLMGYSFDLDTGMYEADIDASQYSGQFTLDVSTLDNTVELLL